MNCKEGPYSLRGTELRSFSLNTRGEGKVMKGSQQK